MDDYQHLRESADAADVIPVEVHGTTRHFVTAAGLEKLGYPELAERSRAAARERLRRRGVEVPVRVRPTTGLRPVRQARPMREIADAEIVGVLFLGFAIGVAITGLLELGLFLAIAAAAILVSAVLDRRSGRRDARRRARL